jgi:hypothetical protein
MTETAAAEALMKANLALERLNSHERFCEERARRADAFEAQTKQTLNEVSGKIDAAMTIISDKIERSNGRIHGRLDGMNKQIIGVLVSIVGGGIGWAIVHLLERGQ